MSILLVKSVNYVMRQLLDLVYIELYFTQPTLTLLLTVFDRKLSSITSQGTLDYNKLYTRLFIITIDGCPVSMLSYETVTGSSLEPCLEQPTITHSLAVSDRELSLITKFINYIYHLIVKCIVYMTFSHLFLSISNIILDHQCIFIIYIKLLYQSISHVSFINPFT